MAYKGEKASSINHQYIIENKLVKDYLKRCEIMGNNIKDFKADNKIEIDSLQKKWYAT